MFNKKVDYVVLTALQVNKTIVKKLFKLLINCLNIPLTDGPWYDV